VSPPSPPETIRPPATHTILEGAQICRFYNSAQAPIYFDRGSSGRFNSPDAAYGVLYAADKLAGAFAETFLRKPGQMIALDLIRKKTLVRLRALQPIKCIKLFGAGLARVGATAEVSHAGSYHLAQAWSAALHTQASAFDGIAYHARHDDTQICYALFCRSAHKIAEASRETTEDPDWIYELAERYGAGIAPDSN
jgi:hypothetical protein